MSPSKPNFASQFNIAVHGLREPADKLLANGEASEVGDDELRELLAIAIKLYAAKVEESGAETLPKGLNVSTTEAIMLACALPRSQDLTPFDLALWFNRNATTRQSSSGI